MQARAEIRRRFSLFVAIVAVNLLGIGAAHAQNAAPVISGTPQTTATPGQAYLFQPIASDPNGDRISYGATGVPRWARFDRKSGRLYGTPTRRDLGKSSNVKISVSDGRLITSLPPFTLQVVASVSTSASNGAPWISGAPAGSAREKELYTFLPQAGDADGDTLTFSVANKPSWATFTTNSGLLSGIPPAGSAGTYSNIVISVSDGPSTRSLPAFGIVVATAANSPPVIYGVPPTSVQAGNRYNFRPTASDPDGQALTFAIENMPRWASFDTATGILAGTPSNLEAGVYPNIVISSSDGVATSSLAPYSVTVVATNALPSIGGAPATSATVGVAYSFIPSASDPDGQRLTFSIVNGPSWAQFDTATGRLTGTPGTANVGTTTSGIVISATDGQDSVSLPAFSLAVVNPVPRGSATLSWSPPTSNVDGTPVTNLAGYRVKYGQQASNLSETVSVPSPGITSVVIENLSTGTWYFAVSAYTTANIESDLSNLAQKTL
jgi:hypothetical protein